jgi:hypothetical protein
MAASINPLNTALNPICHQLALLGAHHILHVSRIRVKSVHNRFLHFNYIHYSHVRTYMTVAVEAAPNKLRSKTLPVNRQAVSCTYTPTYSNHRQSHKALCSRHICTIGAPHKESHDARREFRQCYACYYLRHVRLPRWSNSRKFGWTCSHFSTDECNKSVAALKCWFAATQRRD